MMCLVCALLDTHMAAPQVYDEGDSLINDVFGLCFA